MAVLTKYSLAEAVGNLLEGGANSVSSGVGMDELKVACAQVLNSMLKIDYLNVNEKLGEKIPNGGVIATYENITPFAWTNGRSKATLPVKPLKLPRNMGIYSVFFSDSPEKEFIPLQMGQYNLLKSQPLINDLLGQIGYENFGLELRFTKDLALLYPGKTLTILLIILDITKYSDFDPLPVPPEWEMDIIKQVYALYSTEPVPDKIVDPTQSEQKNIPINQQRAN